MKTSTLIATALLATMTLSACDEGDSFEHTPADEALALDAETVQIPVDELDAEELALNGLGQSSQTVANVIYSCEVDVNNGSTNCDPAIVDANEFDPGEWTAAVDMGSNDFRRMDIFAEICDPSLYAFAISDSPTTNGWGGDSGSADHDAELHLYNSSMLFYSSLDVAHNAYASNTSVGAAHGGGCQVVHTVTYHQAGSHVGLMSFDGGNGSPITMRETHGMKLDYQSCAGGANDPARGISCDVEDAAGNDAGRWYFGLNRTVGSGWRDGTGVERACVVLSDDINHRPDDCLDPVPVSIVPEGTRKTCIEGGSPAQMYASCESAVSTFLGLYHNGTWDYTTNWGNQCPAGTSPVPQSEYYVPGSCNALPNVGAECSGPGSHNYEFKIGVQCQ